VAMLAKRSLETVFLEIRIDRVFFDMTHGSAWHDAGTCVP